jgi:hypothetical protein
MNEFQLLSEKFTLITSANTGMLVIVLDLRI